MRFGIVIVAFLTALAIPTALTDGLARPKVLSLDYCADQYVLSLADREQILGLSPEAKMVHSFYRDRATDLPSTRGTAEEILTLDPDLVVYNWGGDARLFKLLQGAKIATVQAVYEQSSAQVEDNLRALGLAMGQDARGEALALDLHNRFEALQTKNRSPLVAAYVTPGGVTAGAGTTVGDIIELAGFAGIGAAYDIDGWAPLPLERFVADPPDVIIASFFDQPSAVSSHWSVARHARVRAMLDTIPTIYVPGRYLSCNGLFSVDAAELIRREAQAKGLFAASPSGVSS